MKYNHSVKNVGKEIGLQCMWRIRVPIGQLCKHITGWVTSDKSDDIHKLVRDSVRSGTERAMKTQRGDG